MGRSRTSKNTVARIGGLARQAYGDSRAIAARARAGFDRRFYEEALEIDPSLRGEALETKVRLLRSLHFTRLAQKSVKKRERKRGRR